MKAIWIAAVIGLLSFTAAQADPLASDQSQTAQVIGGRCPANALLSRTSYTLPLGPDCCQGELRCTQLLSTDILEKQHTPART